MEWALPLIAATVLAFAAVSRRLDGTSVTAPMVFTAAGLLFGASVAGLVDPSPAGESVKVLAEATLAVVLFSDAARIDLRALREEYRLPARLLGIGLPLTIAAGFCAGLALLGTSAWPEALVLAVVLAPTDAALGQSVVTLPRLPSLVRQGLNVESGLNDGICVPIFTIALVVASTEAGFTGARDAVTLVIEQVGYGALVGAGAGAVAAAVVVFAGRRGLAEPIWLKVVPAAAAALAFTAADAVGGSGFIAAFAGGMVYGGLGHRDGRAYGSVLEELGELFGAATFIVFGAVFLGPALGRLSWGIALYAVLSLTLVRMLPVAVALLGTSARRPTIAFVGWFGPRGLASIVFAVLIVEANGTLPHERVLVTTICVTIGLSVLAHGLSASPLARRYATWHERRGPSGVETHSAHPVSWRRPVATAAAADAAPRSARGTPSTAP